MELGKVISPEAVREALDLAREEFFRENSPEPDDVDAFIAATDFASFSGRLLAGGRVMWACRDGGRLRGMLVLDGARDVRLLFVEHDYRRHGIGRALVAAACEYALDNGSEELCAFVPLQHESMFIRLGFERNGDEYIFGGICGVDMRCDITI